MTASIRLIKIVKDPITGSTEDYTIEVEIIAEESKDLLKEIIASPFGNRVIDLINRTGFLPEGSNKTAEEIKKEAEEEAARIAKEEQEIRDRAITARDMKWRRAVANVVDDEIRAKIDAELAGMDNK